MGYNFAERIQYYMDLRGYKQMALAQKAEIAQASVNRILHSKNMPVYGTLMRVARALGVPTEALTHPDDMTAEIIYELSLMTKEQIENVLHDIRKEKIYRAQLAAERTARYNSPRR